MIATTIDYQKLQDWCPKRLYCCFRLSVVVAIAQGQFLRAGHMVENPGFAIGNFDAICCTFSGITISGFGSHIAISGCRSMLYHLLTLSASSPWSKTPGLPSEL